MMRERQPHPASSRFEDLTGQHFGRLVVLFYVGRMGSNAGWRVRCECGTELDSKATNLKRAQSCGCKSRAESSVRMTTHGATKQRIFSPGYYSWSGIIERCTQPSSKAYKWYGG